MSENAKEWIKDIIIAVVIAVIIIQFIRPTVVKQSSMEPTLQPNNYLFLSKQTYQLFGKEPQRGDIVVFHSNLVKEDGGEKLLIKRVIGLPGEQVKIEDGYVYINGAKLDEDYIMTQGSTYVNGYENEGYIVPEDEVFVMGDNREVSIDSRYEEVGFIPIKEIIGKVVLRAFPIKEFQSF